MSRYNWQRHTQISKPARPAVCMTPPRGSCIFFAQGPMESEIVYVRERQKNALSRPLQVLHRTSERGALKISCGTSWGLQDTQGVLQKRGCETHPQLSVKPPGCLPETWMRDAPPTSCKTPPWGSFRVHAQEQPRVPPRKSDRAQ